MTYKKYKKYNHQSILNDKLLYLIDKQKILYIDNTFGCGNSIKELNNYIKITVVTFDKDINSILYYIEGNMSCNITMIICNFIYFSVILAKCKLYSIYNSFYDIGFSSPQIENRLTCFSRFHQKQKIVKKYYYFLINIVIIFFISKKILIYSYYAQNYKNNFKYNKTIYFILNSIKIFVNNDSNILKILADSILSDCVLFNVLILFNNIEKKIIYMHYMLFNSKYIFNKKNLIIRYSDLLNNNRSRSAKMLFITYKRKYSEKI